MKIKLMFITFFAIISISCITTGTISQPVTSDMKMTNYEKHHVTAQTAVYLRDLPEEYGGAVIDVMPHGSLFTVKTCLTVYTGTKWAYGEYDSPSGPVEGWVAYRYISGGCND